MRILITSVVTIALVIGCATTTKDLMPPAADMLPPDFSVKTEQDLESADRALLELAATRTDEKNSQWWIRYRRAQLWSHKNSDLACQLYAGLAKDSIFPLHKIAYLRAQEVCTADSPHIEGLGEFDLESFDSWLRETALVVALARAERHQDKPRLMELSYERSKAALKYSDKVSLMERALTIAKELEESEKAEEYTERLYTLAPRLRPSPERKDWYGVANDYRRERDFDKARSYYRRLFEHRKSSFSDKVKALKGIRMAYKIERRLQDYGKATEELGQFVEKYYKRNKRSRYFRRIHHDTQITLTRTLWTLGQVTKARGILIKLEKELRGRWTMAEVFWLRGRMAEEKQKFAEAVDWFSKAISEIKSHTEFKENLLWYQAWNLRKVKRHSEAITTFEELMRATTNPFARSRYHYWLARTLRDSGDGVRAHVEFDNLTKDDPLGYYGLLAHHEIKKMIAQAPEPERLPTGFRKTKDLGELLDLRLLEWLHSLDENELAKNYLDEASVAYRRQENQDEETWIAIFNHYARAGSYLSLYEQLGRLPAERRDAILAHHPNLIFPQPFRETVQEAAKAHGISPELIYSIMRQESAFNPRARSHADAFGLMQLLPNVARQSAERAKVQFEQPEDLYKPDVNIPLGSAFLRQLWDRYNGQFVLAVASYNASDDAISGWLKTRFRGDTVEFIEDIPYEETRGYVRLVMRNMIFYSLLGNGGQAIPFPEWCLHIEVPKT